MVYRGKPSTGCKKCRERKIKCDERAEGCFKCVDKGYICPGYDNTLDRYFQDESAHVAKKAQKAKAKSLAARHTKDARKHPATSLRKSKSSIEFPFLIPLTDQGINFFMKNYALGLDQPPLQSEFYHLHFHTNGFHPIIATSMTALGLAGVANIYLDPEFKREATRWYLRAIQMTNKALASPTEFQSDNTLLATMLLSVFEATNNDKSLAGWSSHVEGSASLLRMRGNSQFSTPMGRIAYLQTVSLLSMNCVARGEPLPDYVHTLNKEIAKHENVDDPGVRFYHFNVLIVDFRAQVLGQKTMDLPHIIDRALEIDKSARTVFSEVGEGWTFDEVRCEHGTPGVFADYYHIYAHLTAAQTWNWVRYNRIYLYDIIRNCLLLGFSMTPPALSGARYVRLLEESTATLHKMQADILASIPQYLHDTPKAVPPGSTTYHMTLDGAYDPSGPSTPDYTHTQTHLTSPPPQRPTSASEKKSFWSNFRSYQYFKPFTTPCLPRDRLPIIRTTGGFSFLWALYVAGATPIASPKSQEFVLRSFDRCGIEFGVNQSKVMARALRLRMEMDEKDDAELQLVRMYLPMAGPHVGDE
ncbi:hypothetical protein BDV95DRAFT_287157 [Massariosphaeria phaeospora]|uniref:Zn(2)-C6 fungal-type domain-containing protein n=1 Tax=Massariosphaeria phaeospora TaxID=100035 RepID=A0A7C8IG32_9PLEO|nr:hypothetical protein BDV95DRAFT_287157 [Massariosphaeria phaeospora]